ncbi:MAG: NUDIX domain-containing protein [Candidatus Riflebacteria bacterium]|nr:NUDIX domain-containing protein [Candidatus Riflebacteria bacterium]
MSEGRFLVRVSVLVRAGGATLLVRDGTPASPGRWRLPGRLLGPGADPVAAAQTRVLAETGLPVHLSGLIGVYSDLGADHTLEFAFKGDVERFPPAPTDPAILEARWWEGPDLAGLLATEELPSERLWRMIRHVGQGDLLPLARFWRPSGPASAPQPPLPTTPAAPAGLSGRPES